MNRYASYTLKERTNVLFNAMFDIFGFHTIKSWDEIRKGLSNEQVVEFYSLMNELWPPDTNVTSLLPKPSNALRAFYIGEASPRLDQITQDIVRNSLYCDEILITNPFIPPSIISPKFSPIYHPEQYKQDTLELLAFMFNIAEWVKAGIVSIIPSPADFDVELRKQTWSMAEKRWKENSYTMDEEAVAEASRRSQERVIFRLPDEQLIEYIRSHMTKGTDNEVSRMVDYIKKKRQSDPLLLDQDFNLDGELNILRNGANLEMGLYTSQLTGSFLYTNHSTQWQEINSIAKGGDDQIWSPVTSMMQSLDFKFLGNIDPKFALRLKQEGRLETFRNLLRDVWTTVQEGKLDDSLARHFADEISGRYAEAEAEWSAIDKQLVKWLTGRAGISAVLAGGMDWVIPAMGFCIDGVGQLLNAKTDRNNFRQNVPMSVFVDLKRKRK